MQFTHNFIIRLESPKNGQGTAYSVAKTFVQRLPSITTYTGGELRRCARGFALNGDISPQERALASYTPPLRRMPSSSCPKWNPRSWTSSRFHGRRSTALVRRRTVRGFFMIFRQFSTPAAAADRAAVLR